MKNFLLLIITLFIFSGSGFAQNNISLNIHHKLGDENFGMNAPSKNNIDNDFKITRLQYYISEISILHDGGTETMIADTWVLANASETTEVDLGSHNITEVEGINFHIGVDEAHNHLDPASYPANHPLAPQNPSMHWGWSAGYRFIALEGKGGSNYDQSIELHGLGDPNYFKTQIIYTATAQNDEIAINLDADYNRALENIAVNSGVIVHGDYGDAKLSIENFRDYVFSPSSETTSIVDFNEIASVDLFPNPTNDGLTTLRISATENTNYGVMVTDILGKQVHQARSVNSNSDVDLVFDEPGLYFINLIKDGEVIITKKLMSN